ncbi:ATP-binding protein [Curvibacter sp. RS43]|uniref:sensor histidine kinase n=1 Tax=Curvibacter microcysteis TaxID=3026419 RepID=UPI00235E5766|nr:ATP-binding protein [Curvibacter sp. RS43]MDD0810173.1 ATP-binding protein [Curvibacter sp. RS43]
MFTLASCPQAVRSKLAVMAVWALAWALMTALDPQAELANLALLLVLASALCGLWLSALESLACCALAVLAFNWQFVPPRGTFSVDLRQHLWLLLTMLAVGSMVAWLTGRQRQVAEQARAAAQSAQLLHQVNEQLRQATPAEGAALLASALRSLSQGELAWSLAHQAEAPPQAPLLHCDWGEPSAEDQALLQECQRSASPLEQGLQQGQSQVQLALPLRGATQCHGAALLRLPPGLSLSPLQRSTAQALCDQAGLQLERRQTEQRAQRSSEAAQAQQLRNTLLAAISHDYRTPLANILGAASTLRHQWGKLSPTQANALAGTIVDEVEQLSTLTDNTLQLARLDAPHARLQRDWESLEELVGSAVARARSRYPGVRMGLRIEAGLPLLRCNATLLVQLLNNLVDNAVRYAGSGPAIEIVARRLESELLLAVADRGPGIPSAQRERLFQAFERGPASPQDPQRPSQRGAGLGLALCRAIVLAHGGQITVRQRQRGGASIECRFPLETQPSAQPEALEGDLPPVPAPARPQEDTA